MNKHPRIHRRSRSLLQIAVFALLPLCAAAQSPAPAPGETIDPPKCEKPELPRPPEANANASRIPQKNNFVDLYNAYKACMIAYRDAQGEASKRHIAAANSAVAALNAFADEINKAQSSE